MPQLQAIRRYHVWWRSVAALSAAMLLVCGQALQAMPASSPAFPVPKTLQPNIQFWIRVFSEVDEHGGLLHDPDDLGIIYHTFTSLPLDRQERADVVEQYRQYYAAILEALARGKRQGLTRDEQRVLAMFQSKQTASTFRTASDQLRFQAGIRNRFASGLLRSVAYLPEIERAFSAEGLPKELTLLPHVESSFSNKAYSKHGAAGLWQIMPATGRRFLTVNGRIDERLDVRKASHAAAKILQENYQMLGTWPLALTAYNHGANGMKRAVEAVGTTDIGVIVERYDGASFGFASRNFYAEFLAAVHITRNTDRYFGNLRGFVAPPTLNTMSPAPTVVQRANRQKYRVQRGDTFIGIAQRFNTSVDTLAQLNNLPRSYYVQAGQTLLVPREATRQQVASQGRKTVPQAPAQSHPVTRPVVKPVKKPKKAMSVAKTTGREKTVKKAATTEKRAKASRRTKTVAQASKSSKGTKSQTARRKQYRVQRGDNLTAIASRFGTTVQTLVTLNKLRPPYYIQPGQMLTVSRTVARRYQVRPGDTLRDIAARFSTTPSTLVDINDLDSPDVIHPGQKLLVPPAEPQAALFLEAFSQDIG